MYFRIGDLVRVRKDCTIGELIKDKWNLSHRDTLEFLGNFDERDCYNVYGVSKRGNVILKNEDDEDIYVNHNLLEVVERAKDRAVEMSIDEISAELGYPVKIVTK